MKLLRINVFDVSVYNTYIDCRGVGNREHSGGRRLLRNESVKFLIIKVPFDRVQRHSFQIVVAGQPQRFARSDSLGIPNPDAYQAEHVCGQTRQNPINSGLFISM